MKRLFLDTEFTGLHKNTTLISIGLVSEEICQHYEGESFYYKGESFYAEFNDYDKSQVDEWLSSNVINNLWYNNTDTFFREDTQIAHHFIRMKGNKHSITEKLRQWLEGFGEKLEIWTDFSAFDWVLFTDLFGKAQDVPSCVYYIPFDICTLFKMLNIDPDIDRHKFSGVLKISGHHGLHDTIVISACYQKLMDRISRRQEL